MGVQDTDQYPEIKRLLGIPEDEPIFILRAQDQAFCPTLAAYAAIYAAIVKSAKPTPNAPMTLSELGFADGVEDVYDSGRFWQHANINKVKIPD